ncbi:MAG: TRAP transporter large permease [Clostridiales bacterium]|nr:TRAP transporter large permease [Clostridiales bacterium]
MSTTVIILIVGFFLLVALGVPVAFAIGASAIFSIIVDGSLTAMIVPQRMFVMMDSFSLMAIPLFLLAGELMSVGGITKRIVRFASAMVGHLRASLAHVTILSSMLMAGISGSASADTSAIGSIMIPAMVDEGYDEDLAVCVVASANTVGPIIPPSIMMIIFGSMTGASIGAMFLGGIVPGELMGLSLMVIVSMVTKKRQYPSKPKASAQDRWKAFASALAALLMPVIILGGILSGIFTATEAGAVACIYALIFGIATRNLNIKNLYELMKNAVMGTTIPMFIIGIAAVFGWIMTRYNFPQAIAAGLFNFTSNPTVFILLVMGLYFILGMFMEANAGMIIMTPIIYPIALAYGFSAVHLGVITVVMFCIGSVTPPVGLQLFIACSIAKIPLSRVIKTVWPYVIALTVVCLLCAVFPFLVEFVPNLLMN